MYLEYSPVRSVPGTVSGLDGAPRGPPDNDNFWHSLINEREAGDFLGLTDRAMQKMRQTGGGANFIRISSRCVRYRRIDLKTWADQRVRTSTSDPGQEAA